MQRMCPPLRPPRPAPRRPVVWSPTRRVSRVSALTTVLALLTLYALSGPHLVHHLLAPEPTTAHHGPHDAPPDHATGPTSAGADATAAAPWATCQILWLLQHLPVLAAAHLVCLPWLLSSPSLLPVVRWRSSTRRLRLRARAPPSALSILA